MREDGKLDYLELPATDLAAHKAFYSRAFGWTFQDYGPDYAAFDDGELQGGFCRGNPATSEAGAPLVVLYAAQLAPVQAAVEAQGGSVVKPVFAFPGGRRFQFVEPGGNELAVWSERESD